MSGAYTGLTAGFMKILAVVMSWSQFAFAGSLTVADGPAASTVPMIAGCRVFPQNDFYNTSIATAPADASSSQFIDAAASLMPGSPELLYGGNGANGYFINLADNTVPTYGAYYPRGPFAMPSTSADTSFPYNDSMSYQNKQSGIPEDHHLIVLNTSNCSEHVLYSSHAEPRTAPFSPAFYLDACLTGHLCNTEHFSYWANYGSPLPQPGTQGNINLAGTPYMAGMMRYTDYANNTPHVLNLDIRPHTILNTCGVYPSSGNGDCSNRDRYYRGTFPADEVLPTGAHLRIKASYNFAAVCSPTACPEATFIVNTLKNFGGVISDTGAQYIFLYIPQMQNTVGGVFQWGDGTTTCPGGANCWNSPDVEKLNKVPFNSTVWEVVPPPGCSSVTACEH